MKWYRTSSFKKWIVGLLAVAALAGGYLVVSRTQIEAQDSMESTGTTVTVQPASAVISAVSAAGNIELVSYTYVAIEVDGLVDGVAVDVGDQVQDGDLLLSLNTGELARAVAEAQLTVEANQLALTQLREPATAAELTAAVAAVTEAQQNLDDVMAGPDSAEVTAAQSRLSAAWATYNELEAGPTSAELAELNADLKSAEVAVAEAQTAYDKIAWQTSAGMTSEAADLQTATIAYEKALATYQQSTADPATSELQAALADIQDAQATLDDLLNSPTQAEIASAQSQLASAQATLDELEADATDADVRSAQITLEQSLLELEQAYSNLSAARLLAPAGGTVLEVAVARGEHVSSGTVVVTLADTTQLQLTIDVAETDIVEVAAGQAAEVEIDALSGQTFEGVVAKIAPSSDDDSSVVSYAVTIRLVDEVLDKVLPGMTAVATLTDTNATSDDEWLVPTNAIQQQGDNAVVLVVDATGTTPVTVVPMSVDGDWTVVQTTGLSIGDQVLGSVASVEAENMMGGPGGGAPPSGAVGGGAMMP